MPVASGKGKWDESRCPLSHMVRVKELAAQVADPRAVFVSVRRNRKPALLLK